MRLASVRMQGFRNLEPLHLELSPGLNVIHGPNAQGKSNFLEGLSFLASLTSFRGALNREVIGFGREVAHLVATLEQAGLIKVLEVHLASGKRAASVDGAAARSTAQYLEHARACVFTAEDLGLVSGSPNRRRRFLDRALVQANPDFAALLKDHLRSLAQRNALLAQGRPSASLLDVWDSRIAYAGARITAGRLRYLKAILPHFQASWEEISGTRLPVTLVYAATIEVSDSGIAALERHLLGRMEASRAEELRRGTTLVGPHLDDLHIMLDGRAAAPYASQGQMRMLALALKVAELEALAERLGILPIMLLDDVSAELDEDRNRYLMSHLKATGCQTFVTTTSPSNVPTAAWADRASFAVREGRIYVGADDS